MNHYSKRRNHSVIYLEDEPKHYLIFSHGTINIRTTDKDDHAVIEVEDMGRGIPENLMDKIFEPLFTTKEYGTGLGLKTCKNIIEQHKGKITFRNNPTTFTVMLPK